MTPVCIWLVITQSCTLWNTTQEQFWVMTPKYSRFTLRAHSGIRLLACNQLNSQKYVTYLRNSKQTLKLPILHRLRSLEWLLCFIFLSLKDLNQKQITLMSPKFRSWKQKLNRITGAKLFTFNESLGVFLKLFSYSLVKCINIWFKLS